MFLTETTVVADVAIVQAILLIKQDDDDTNREISNDESEDPGESTL